MNVTTHSSTENSTLQSSRQSFVTKIRELFFLSGITYPVVAAFGSGTSISHEWEEHRVVPSGRVTLTDACMVLWFLVCAFGLK